jgi:hypothetical protein
MAVCNCLKKTVIKELNIVEYTKNIGYYTSDESINKVFINQDKITTASKKYDVPKEMIQAVLFKEIRMIDFRDDISDCLVDNCYKINRFVSVNHSKDLSSNFISNLTNIKGSSTGIGQIFPHTAIKAYNWYFSYTYKVSNNNIDYNDVKQREEIWRALQDDEININFVALILKYEATHNLRIDINNASDDDIKKLFTRYNGAISYGDEVFK